MPDAHFEEYLILGNVHSMKFQNLFNLKFFESLFRNPIKRKITTKLWIVNILRFDFVYYEVLQKALQISFKKIFKKFIYKRWRGRC